MRLRARPSLVSVAFLIALSAFGAMSDVGAETAGARWKALGEADGIAVEMRAFEGSTFPEVRASGTVCATLPELVAFVQDVARFERWIPDTEAARLLARPTPQDQIYYIRTSMPWPIKHRDMIYRLTESTLAPVAGEISVSIDGEPSYLPAYPGVVRMASVTGRWTFREDRGRTHIELVMHIEPGGIVPGWLASQRVIGTPSKMLANLKRQFEASCRDLSAAAAK